MVGLNMLFLTLLHVAQLALVIVVVVFAIRAIKKGSTHRVLMGSLIADENVLGVRDITMPPYTGGPWSSVARNTSTLGRLSVGGEAVYTEAYKWMSYGFERRATASDGTAVHTSAIGAEQCTPRHCSTGPRSP